MEVQQREMENYGVGKKCSGRIINIYQGNWIVELEQGVIGRVLNGTFLASLEAGALINVQVKQNDGNGIILEYIQVSEVKKEEGQKGPKPWNNWKDMPAGHGQAMTAMFALRTHTDAFLSELTSARKEWEDAKASSQQIYDSVTSSARKQCEDDRQRFNMNYAPVQTDATYQETEMQIASEAIYELSLEGFSASEKAGFKQAHKIDNLPSSSEKEFILALLSLRNGTYETQRLDALRHISIALSFSPNDPRFIALANVLQEAGNK